MEHIFIGAWKDKRGIAVDDVSFWKMFLLWNSTINYYSWWNSLILIFNLFLNKETYVEDEEGLQRRHKVDTTLQVHFFGKKGNQDLHYEVGS